MSTVRDLDSDDWYFAAGTTVRGVQQWLVLDNPYASEPRSTSRCARTTGCDCTRALQGVDVPGRSRAVIAIHDYAVRQERVAVEVVATIGEVVAAQTIGVQLRRRWPRCRARRSACSRRADRWWFTDGASLSGATDWVAIANLGTHDAQVDVQALLESGEAIVAGHAHRVPGRGGWVRSATAPTGRRRAACACPTTPRLRALVRVRRRGAGRRADDQPVRARTVTQSASATSTGSTGPAPALGRSRPVVSRANDRRRSSVSSTRSRRPRTSRVDARARADGSTARDALQAITVPPGAPHDRRASSDRGTPRATRRSIIDVDRARSFVERSIDGRAPTSAAPPASRSG